MLGYLGFYSKKSNRNYFGTKGTFFNQAVYMFLVGLIQIDDHNMHVVGIIGVESYILYGKINFVSDRRPWESLFLKVIQYLRDLICNLVQYLGKCFR